MKLETSLILISLLTYGSLALANSGAPAQAQQQGGDDKPSVKSKIAQQKVAQPKPAQPKPAAAQTTTARLGKVIDPDLTRKETANAQETLAKSKTSSKAKIKDKFIPSEEISEDLAVSFPVDI